VLGGVIVLVTGVITRKWDRPRQFVQSFFLARQDNNGRYIDLPHYHYHHPPRQEVLLSTPGCSTMRMMLVMIVIVMMTESVPSYFVLNDTFRFLDVPDVVLKVREDTITIATTPPPSSSSLLHLCIFYLSVPL